MPKFFKFGARFPLGTSSSERSIRNGSVASLGSTSDPEDASQPSSPEWSRAGVLRTSRSITTDGSGLSDDENSFAAMEDDAPLRRFVTRTHSFDQVDFDALIQNPDLYTVHNAAGAGLSPRHYASATPPTGVKQPVVLNRPRRSSGERPRSKSVLGMPTFRPDSTFYKYWSSLILALDLTYSAFVVPISIGMLTSFLVLNWTSALDYTVGAFFLADLIVSFHVGFIATYNLRKVLVLNGKLIAKFYMQHDTFIFDILSVTAWLVQLLMLLLSHVVDEFNPTVALFIMEALRLVRFLRVVKLIRKLLVNAVYAPLNQSSWMKWASSATFHYLFYIVYVIAVLVNFLGCMWNFTAGAQGFDNTWANYYPPFVRSYSEDGMTALTADEVQHDVDQVWRYFVGTYWALTTIATVGFGDVTPATLVETIVVIIVEVIGIMFFGILLSTISELLSNSNKDARRAYVFRKKLTTVDRWMKGTRLPSHLQRRIKSFYAEVWLHHVESSEDTHLFRELPHILRNEVAWNALQAAMARIPFFEDMSTNMKWTLCSKFEPVRFGPGEDILSEGDKAEKCWVMLEGEVVSLHHYMEAGSLQGPALLGSTVVLQDLVETFKSSPCTLRTLSSCICWQVRWKDLRLLLDYHPNVRRALESRIMAQVCCHITLYPSAWMDSQLLHPELQDAKARAEEMAKDLWEGPSQSQVRFDLPSGDKLEPLCDLP
uniref:Cyclic nucleotide-binding domain-containing protein n=2 Tax=Auxenochlorella protothecoides TaxID=3075 RepID=A0A1D1ZXT6_AUXPR